MTISPNARSITSEDIQSRLLDTLRDDCGAGSDMQAGIFRSPWLEVNGYLDIEHLTSNIEQMITDAGGTVA